MINLGIKVPLADMMAAVREHKAHAIGMSGLLVKSTVVMRENLAAALQVEVTAISVKGKTNEGVDSMGRGEAMACHAVALLTSNF